MRRPPAFAQPVAFRPEAMRYFTASSTAMEAHRFWLDGLVLLTIVFFGLLSGYFVFAVLPASFGLPIGSAASRTLPFHLPNPLALLSPASTELPAVPAGATQSAQGVIVQVANPARSKTEGGREAAGATSFLLVTAVIDNQGAQPLAYGLQDWQLRDAKGKLHAAETIRSAGWLSSGTVAPGQSVQGTVAFLVPDGEAQPRVLFNPKSLRIVMSWIVP